MRKAFGGFLRLRNANKHLLFIDSHSMLIIFVGANMLQFIFTLEQVEAVFLTLRGGFLALSFLIYVLGRAFQQKEHHDLLVIVAFSSFVFYRIFVENLVAHAKGVELERKKTSWVVIGLYCCTGIPIKVLLWITFVAFLGLILEAAIVDKLEIWAVDVPLFFVYSASGLILYYTFFCIGTEICRLRHRPLRAIKDLPSPFFDQFELQALNSLPVTVLNKKLSREEHLYILLRITQMPSPLRDVAFQFIGEDSKTESALADKDKLISGFLRSALIQHHLADCSNPALRNLTLSMGGVVLESITDDPFNQMITPSRAVMPEKSPTTASVGKMGYSELNLLRSMGKSGRLKENNRPQIEALATEVTISMQVSDSRHQTSYSVSGMSSLHHENSEKFAGRGPTCQSNLNPEGDTLSQKLVTVGTVKFPLIDVERAATQARVERGVVDVSRPSQQLNNRGTPSRSWQTMRSSARQWQATGAPSIRRRSWIPLRGSKRPRNSVSEALGLTLQGYDAMLRKVINPMFDPMSVQIDRRMGFLQVPGVQRYCPCFTQFARWLQGVEAVMTTAQWRSRVHVPRRGLFGRFLDTKIERWFMAWAAAVQARQYILLSPLVSLLTIIIILVTWDVMIFEAMSSTKTTRYRYVVVYMAVRTVVHLSALLFIHPFQNVKDYQGPDNAHYFKRRAAFIALLGLFLSFLDTLMHQLLIPGRLGTTQFIIIAVSTFPMFGQLTTTAHAVVGLLLNICIFALLPVFIESSGGKSTVQLIFIVEIGISLWMAFMSRCIFVNYRLLFCRYVLPYLLYLDSLQYPLNTHTPLTSSEDDSIDNSDYDSYYSEEATTIQQTDSLSQTIMPGRTFGSELVSDVSSSIVGGSNQQQLHSKLQQIPESSFTADFTQNNYNLDSSRRDDSWKKV